MIRFDFSEVGITDTTILQFDRLQHQSLQMIQAIIVGQRHLLDTERLKFLEPRKVDEVGADETGVKCRVER